MQSSGIIMSYKGAASGDLLNSIIAITQTKLTEVEHKSGIRRRLFSILVEILQNIQNHFDHIAAEDVKDDDAIVFVLARAEDSYRVLTGNYIPHHEVLSLKRRIDEVNAMTSEELKTKYRDTLDNGQVSPKGGAGLGIIDIARKSSDKLEYDFRPVNDKYSFFSLSVKVAAV
jgi:hypothetical protein